MSILVYNVPLHCVRDRSLLKKAKEDIRTHIKERMNEKKNEEEEGETLNIYPIKQCIAIEIQDLSSSSFGAVISGRSKIEKVWQPRWIFECFLSMVVDVYSRLLGTYTPTSSREYGIRFVSYYRFSISRGSSSSSYSKKEKRFCLDYFGINLSLSFTLIIATSSRKKASLGVFH